jgi:hypothetical protein
MTSRWLMIAAFGLAGVQARASAQELPVGLRDYLRGAVGLDSAQVEAVRRGEPVVSALATELPREIALFGIAAVHVTREEYVRSVLGLGAPAGPPTRRHLGIFSDPPTLEDVRDVVIAQRDAKELKGCRPGACVMKLPGAAMARFRDAVDGSAGDAEARVSALARQSLIEYVADYRARGDAALVVYEDGGRIQAGDAFADLLAATPQAYQGAPALQRYLTGYPQAVLPGATEVLFWSEDELPPLRPVLSVTHLVAYPPPDHPDLVLVAAKQIYANHYVEAALDLTCFVESGPGGGYLAVLRRYRLDRLPSGGPVDVRRRAAGAMREQLLADLRLHRNR